MKRIIHFSIVLFFLLQVCLTLSAKVAGDSLTISDPFFLQHLDNRNGLSNSSINHIFKDADNVLWIATWDGLNMYNGTSFHVFNYSKENDYKSIGSNVIQHITEDKKGNIWISTIEGISRYEKRTGKFYNYFYNQYQKSRISEQEYALAVDTSGMVYCLNRKTGLLFYDAGADSFRNSSLVLPEFSVNKLAFDATGHLWLLTANGGLFGYEGNANHFKRLIQLGENLTGGNGARGKETIVNFFPVNNQVFFSTSGDRLFLTDNKTLRYKQVMQLPRSMGSMVHYKDHYLIAWSTKGFEAFDTAFQPSAFLKPETRQMQDVKITSWTTGSEEILWCGTDGNGMIKISPKTKFFGTVTTSDNGMPYNKSVRAFCEENGNLWIGTKGSGIIRYTNFWTSPQSPSSSGNQSEFSAQSAQSVSAGKQFFLFPGELDNNSVYSLKKGNDNLIYIGTDGKGIGVYDLSLKKFYKWAAIKGTGAYPEFGSVYAILQDRDNSLWLGTSGYGLLHLKINRDKTGSLSLGFLERFTFTNSDSGPANDIIYALADGGETHQQLWIGCRYGGLSVLDKRTHKFRTFKAFTYEGSLSNNDVLSIFKDSRSRIWIGTSYGLNWIENADAGAREPVFQKLTISNGLPNNTIHAIEEDGTGHIWVSTNRGLAKVNESDLKVSYYQQSDGLQSNEFCDGAVWKDSNDHLFFGGTYGFNQFLPQNIRETSWRPDLLLSGILMGGKTTAENGFIKMEPGINKPLDFSISRKDNFFELDTKAISFLNADKCEYAYYLEGYDKSWHFSGTSGKIAYSNIPPGRYSLQMKWSDGEGSWTPQVPLLVLHVKQYFWLTPYAFLVYALLVSLIIYLLYTYRKNKLEIKHQLAVEHVLRTKEEEMHQNRLAFFTNIAHELQTPLTLIMGSAERFLDRSKSTQPAKENRENPYFLSVIHQQASRLTYLVRQLLEFRKGEAGFSKNQYSHLNISELLHNLTGPFIPLSEQNGMRYVIQIQPDLIGWVDKDKVEKIIFNLLSNAFKHSGKNEEILFSAVGNKGSGELEIEVVNSGSSLPVELTDKLFDTFYVASQYTPGMEKFGTGIGLAFTKQMVILLNGRIEAQSQQEEERVTFRVFLPLPPAGLPEPAAEWAAETGSTPAVVISDKPSYLYQTITAYDQSGHHQSATDNNKRAIIENLQEEGKKTILIVEDEPDIRYLLKDILKDDYILYEAEDGLKALDLIGKVLPDLVICDVMMPNMNGLELCNKMKNTPATCQIPFIVLSARGSEDHQMQGYEVGADAYMAKPFHTAHLKLRVRKLLEYRQRLHDLFKSDKATDQLGESGGITRDDKEFLTRLVQMIEEHLDEPDFNAACIEKNMNMSKMQLFRKLKTMTGMPPGEFIKHIRLKHAAHLLITTHHTVSEIFFSTGFNNQSYFFREFKKRYNSAPNEYREAHTLTGTTSTKG
ncbi:two-component regulator propeller domain-containing protein [Flavitalea flava]